MNLQRTPPSSILTSGSESAGGSVPNLPTVADGSFIGINPRKRKERTEEQDYQTDFTSFRNDIMKFLEDFGRTQNENFTHIRQEISEIKNEIKTIKSTTESFTQQFEKINNDIQNIKLTSNTTQDKIKIIETEISQIKDQQYAASSTPKPPPLPSILGREDLILELKDRCDREKNIVVVGILEKNDKNLYSRRIYDNEQVMKVISPLYENCPVPNKTIRLGKYIPNKSRPVKIYFESTDTPRHLLRNKTKLPENIQMYADQTPTQRQYLQSVKEELNERTDNGEKDLIIKYIKGTPRIVINKANPKNQ